MNLYYAAGIFDGEGYVYIFRKTKHSTNTGYYISAGVNMCHYPTIKAFYDQFGGHLNSGSERVNPNHRPLFQWGTANQVAEHFLKIIRPYVIVKADEIDVALKLQAHIRENKYVSSGRTHMSERPDRDAILAYREELYQRCKALKQVAFAPLLRKGPGPNGRPRGRPKGR